MIEEFKEIITGLEQRISLYKSKLHDLQKKRDKVEDEISTVKKYLELAETLYRVEIEKANVASASVSGEGNVPGEGEKGKREHPDGILIEKTKYAGLSVPRGAFMVLKDAGKALHAKEIYRRLTEGGGRIRGKTPITSVATSLSRDKNFKKVSPNTFLLVEEFASENSGQEG
ncbi:MAG: winged helix-turn-helix domain-containing protein [Nitrospirae bacterium]|nr:winged helix-turn-helix domain-containing protein [Candidatus Troglogloeales bacterium]MBI3597899.1 winged helix-turn-helix domain-containing protein [Candidatus Troglogloeales bacterium]